MIDRFRMPILTPLETAEHLKIPERTIHRWLTLTVAGQPLVHSVPPERRGRPSIPFIALVEAHVLRSLRNIGLSTNKIALAAETIRREFRTPYGLANRRIATDGIDIFIDYLETDEIARASDQQTPIRGVIKDYLKYITWADDDDDFPNRLILKQYAGAAEVVIDPRFAWGAPVVEPAHVPVEAVSGMWRAGETTDVVASEYGLSLDQVEALIRVAA